MVEICKREKAEVCPRRSECTKKTMKISANGGMAVTK
jgi:hypothetical protein